MTLDKAIKHGKEHRKEYHRSQAFDDRCRPGGGCPFCANSRQHSTKKRKLSADEQIKEIDGMRIQATRIMIKPGVNESLWYGDKRCKVFWAERVGSEWPWKIIQEGSNLTNPLYVHKDDAVVIEERTVEVELVQTVTVAE